MALKMVQLPRTQFTGLDYENIMRDITQLVTENPNYNKEWEDFLSSNAGRMLVELYAYITDQLATRIDWFINESYLSTATQKKSIMRLLKIIGYNFKLPYCSEVDVTLSFDRPVGQAVLTPAYNTNTSTLIPFSLTAKDKNGQTVNFEALEFNQISERFEYKNAVSIYTGTTTAPFLEHNVKFYEGTTRIDTFTVEDSNNQIFTLTQSPVMENSIRVYKVLNPNTEIVSEEELLQVQSFLDPNAQSETDSFGIAIPIPFVVNVLEDDEVNIEFGPTEILPSTFRRPKINDIIRVFYRTGGGVNGNISKKSINYRRTLLINNISTNILFTNNTEGINGKDGEDPEYAKVFAPLQIRTAGKTVTENDYAITLESNNTIIKSKSYGNNNAPANVRSLYGIHLKPLEVWNYVLKNKPGWENVPPSKYNDFNWIDLRLENRFNEIHAFRDGEFNVELEATNRTTMYSSFSLNWNGTETRTFKNFVLFRTSDRFKQAVASPDFKLKATIKEIPYDYYYEIENENAFYENISKTEGEINNSNFCLKENMNSFFMSPINIAENVNMSVNKNITLGLDNRETIIIDLSGLTPSSTTPEEIKENINTALETNYVHTGISGTPGDQTLSVGAINIVANTKYYFRLNGERYFVEFESTPDINEIATAMKEATAIKIDGDFLSNFSIIRNVNRGTLFRKLKKGHKLLSSNFSTEETISFVNFANYSVTVGSNSTETIEQDEFTVYPFNFEVNTNDIIITNNQEDPVGPVWIEPDTLIDAATITIGAPTPSYGIKGYQRLNINGVIEATRGFQCFSATEDPVVATGNYKFKLAIDGVAFNSGNDNTVGLLETDGLSEIATKIDALFTTEASCEIDENGRIRITSATTGNTSTIELTEPTPGETSLITLLGGAIVGTGFTGTIDGQDDGLLNLDPDTYYFKVNDCEYSVDVTLNMTYLDLIDELNIILAPNYALTLEDEEWNDEILVENETTGWVNFGKSETTPDLFSSLTGIKKVVDEELIEEDWTDFDIPVGGGDYSKIAEVMQVDNKKYLRIESPSWGEFSSILEFASSSNSILQEVFGFSLVSPNTRKCYGYTKLSVLSNSELTEQSTFPYGNVLWENGCDRFCVDPFNIYLNYIDTDENTLTIGAYHNENFDEDDPSWREPANRIYNTFYNEQAEEIDINNSNFELRFTRDYTDKLSIFAIEDDWNLQEAINPTITSETITDQLDETHYKLRIAIDGLTPVEFDITNNLGISETYDISELASTINSVLRNAYDFDNIYNSFVYASLNEDGNKIILKSPTNNNDSSIEFTAPVDKDATEVLFGITSYPHTILATGDYFIHYDSTSITGTISLNSSWITNVSDISKVNVGDIIAQIPNKMKRSRVAEISGNSFRVNTTSFDDATDIVIKVSNDMMKITKIIPPDGNSKMPDTPFNIHFVFDKRYVEGVFDGATVGQVQMPGFPLGSLDEDIYQDYLEDKRIVGINNVFKETGFKTFDISGIVYYNGAFTALDIEQRLEAALEEEYSLTNRNIGSRLSRSKILNVVQSVSGVEYVDIEYIGPDLSDSSTNIGNWMECNFDEIIVLSEKIYESGELIHGIKFIYRLATE